MGYKTYVKNMLLGILMGECYLAKTFGVTPSLALTFDDGPDPVHTPKLLDVLQDHGVKATFFITGVRAERHPEIVRRIVAEGHEIGNHSYRHVKFAALPVQDQLDEIEQTDRVLTEYDGRRRHWFRPPGGRLPLKLVLSLFRRRHRLAMWSYDSLDYQNSGVPPIVARFRSTPVRSGEIILFHDDNDFTVLALKLLLPQWRAQGYEFGLISQGAVSDLDVG